MALNLAMSPEQARAVLKAFPDTPLQAAAQALAWTAAIMDHAAAAPKRDADAVVSAGGAATNVARNMRNGRSGRSGRSGRGARNERAAGAGAAPAAKKMRFGTGAAGTVGGGRQAPTAARRASVGAASNCEADSSRDDSDDSSKESATESIPPRRKLLDRQAAKMTAVRAAAPTAALHVTTKATPKPAVRSTPKCTPKATPKPAIKATPKATPQATSKAVAKAVGHLVRAAVDAEPAPSVAATARLLQGTHKHEPSMRRSRLL